MNEEIAEKMFVKIIKSKYKLLCFFHKEVFPFIFKFIDHLNNALNTRAVYMYGALDAKTLIHNVRSTCFENSKKHMLCSQKTILNFIKKKLEQKRYLDVVMDDYKYTEDLTCKDVSIKYLNGDNTFFWNKNVYYFEDNTKKINKRIIKSLKVCKKQCVTIEKILDKEISIKKTKKIKNLKI